MAIQIGAKPDSGFDDPIGMLKDCHRRIESFLGILCVVVEHARGRMPSAEEKSALQAAFHYFRLGGQRHTADEEESLFPRLRALSTTSLDAIERLESDHQNANDLHQSIEHLYMDWISSGTLVQDDENRLLSKVKQLKELYAEHIQVEETVVFPHAAQVLDAHAIAAIGTEFIMRRN